MTMEIILGIVALAVCVWFTVVLCKRNADARVALKDVELENRDRIWQERLSGAEAAASGEKCRLEAMLEAEKEAAATGKAAAREQYESMLKATRDGYESQLAALRSSLLDARKNYEVMVAELKENQEKTLARQVEAMRAEMTAQTEAVLKAREAELDKKAEETFKNITGALGKDLEEMKKSFNENKVAQTESSASLKEHLENAVKNLKEQTASIGMKADHLADALRGQNKMQGCFGETVLENLLIAEGFKSGVDYEREFVLRDEVGLVVANEDSEKNMRPDVIIHYPDDTEVIIDSKVDLKALSDWSEATDEAKKAEAAQRNLKAIKKQVENLSKKDYGSYIPAGKKSLGYVLMFVPVYGALQLAKSIDPDIWRDAFRKNVLITTEETLVPFLRMIRTAWCNVEQIRNQQNIIKAAEEMIARVSDMAVAFAKLGKGIDALRTSYDSCEKKLRNSGKSIIVSANKVISFGVKPRAGKDKLPALYGADDADADLAEDTSAAAPADGSGL